MRRQPWSATTTGGPSPHVSPYSDPTGERPQHPGEATAEEIGRPPSPGPSHPPGTVATVPSSTSRVTGSSELLRGLTVAQQQAVESPSAPLCVLAAAGSGKTTVLARRVARRILDGSVRAEHTLVVTFTRKASRELRGRLARLGVPGLVSAGTFHALALAQLRRHFADHGLRAPVLVDDPTLLVRAALGTRASAGPAHVAAVLGELHWAQVRLLGPEDYRSAASAAGRDLLADISHDEVAEAYAAYLAEKSGAPLLDLDDLVTRCASLLEEDEVAAAAQRWRIRHLFVDEFQDVNPAQWRLLARLARGPP